MFGKNLMIGDYVSIGNRNYKVVTTSKGTMMFEFSKSEGMLPIWAEYNPISLTDDIMAANGFRNEDGIWLSEDCSYGIDNQKGTMEFFKYRMFEDDSELEVQIPYCYEVHTFQHALRLSGLNKLADNFKLD